MVVVQVTVVWLYGVAWIVIATSVDDVATNIDGGLLHQLHPPRAGEIRGGEIRGAELRGRLRGRLRSRLRRRVQRRLQRVQKSARVAARALAATAESLSRMECAGLGAAMLAIVALPRLTRVGRIVKIVVN